MINQEARIGLWLVVLTFSFVLFFFRKKIVYPFCPLRSYTGKIGKGKASSIFLFHLVISFGLSLASFSLLDKIEKLDVLFEDSFVRIPTVLTIWLVWGFLIGLTIEKYLVSTDKDYKEWKVNYLKK